MRLLTLLFTILPAVVAVGYDFDTITNSAYWLIKNSCERCLRM
jgi:hypothetical protein